MKQLFIPAELFVTWLHEETLKKASKQFLYQKEVGRVSTYLYFTGNHKGHLVHQGV